MQKHETEMSDKHGRAVKADICHEMYNNDKFVNNLCHESNFCAIISIFYFVYFLFSLSHNRFHNLLQTGFLLTFCMQPMKYFITFF